jgi:hypothetical protein
MIGRAAQGRPWIFREVAHYLATGTQLAEPALAEVRDVMLGHLEHLHAFYGELAGVRIARKHLGWYAKDRPENFAFRAVVNRAETAEAQLRLTTRLLRCGWSRASHRSCPLRPDPARARSGSIHRRGGAAPATANAAAAADATAASRPACRAPRRTGSCNRARFPSAGR